jgi:hypothetical protein
MRFIGPWRIGGCRWHRRATTPDLLDQSILNATCGGSRRGVKWKCSFRRHDFIVYASPKAWCGDPTAFRVVQVEPRRRRKIGSSDRAPCEDGKELHGRHCFRLADRVWVSPPQPPLLESDDLCRCVWSFRSMIRCKSLLAFVSHQDRVHSVTWTTGDRACRMHPMPLQDASSLRTNH